MLDLETVRPSLVVPEQEIAPPYSGGGFGAQSARATPPIPTVNAMTLQPNKRFWRDRAHEPNSITEKHP